MKDIGCVVRIPEKGYARDGWNSLLENLQPLGTDVRAKDGVAGNISSRSGGLGTSPTPTGSPIEIMTIGIVVVACLAAKLAGVA